MAKSGNTWCKIKMNKLKRQRAADAPRVFEQELRDAGVLAFGVPDKVTPALDGHVVTVCEPGTRKPATIGKGGRRAGTWRRPTSWATPVKVAEPKWAAPVSRLIPRQG
jgi:hypothetical protein